MTEHTETRRAFINGHIFTAENGQPWAEAVLIEDGLFVAVGSNDEIRALAHNATLHDLGGKMVMPGIHDAHTHLLFSGLKFRSECRLRENAGPDEIVDDLCSCDSCLGGKLGGWIVGGEFNPNVFEAGKLDRSFLDAAFPDTPVFLYEYTIHHGLANSKALELAGIDASTLDPWGGKYVRREGSNEPTGVMVERATWPVQRAIPRYSNDTYRDALEWAIAVNHKMGITSVQEASASHIELELLNQLDREGALNMHIAAHLVWQEEGFGGGVSSEELDQLIVDRADYASEHVRTNFVKCWLDGAPLPPFFTEAGLDPGTGNADASSLLIPEDELVQALAGFDRAGLSLKIHCAGEGSVRAALNAVERVRQQNGPGVTHEVAHTTFFHPDDLARFAANNVVAEMSPAIWHLKGPEFAGLAKGYKFASLHKAGTHVTIGSDWIITPDPNLFPALQGVVERGEESVDLATALKMMTIAGATAVGMEEQIGSVSPGKSADFIVLDRDLFSISSSEIGDTKVLLTVFEGRTVFDRGKED
ncbi:MULTISPECIES: amidohydrolase [unclassified Sphingobium]|uniref:amidohydrolase n=1 Tax=unclassified Sphingobium TaxID=2611147 RepID=UPI000D17636D|nr:MULTISPECIES: amidohydrolase [unclassified Sphingobium]MBG6120430.1 putative amidohydrolase YtcJ [Sphingobium sp. JAI105]PSO10028.1 amidohydrolase [Sphingobium sp. AEW4]TWC98922.1 hypothetical protein FB595_12514 [Sphingobium sp. AEW010]TWD18401.1 hypothetical protein FB596_12614 [Sphingobium sp. AEW013]TWD21029.1 hypothetical protein FB594_12614 [Sphingobium sp. AEW001]